MLKPRNEDWLNLYRLLYPALLAGKDPSAESTKKLLSLLSDGVADLFVQLEEDKFALEASDESDDSKEDARMFIAAAANLIENQSVELDKAKVKLGSMGFPPSPQPPETE
jgi:hypothetical protein